MAITIEQFTAGTSVFADMPPTSFYLCVRGKVIETKNGYAQIQTTEVKDRYSKTWKLHEARVGAPVDALILDLEGA